MLRIIAFCVGVVATLVGLVLLLGSDHEAAGIAVTLLGFVAAIIFDPSDPHGPDDDLRDFMAEW
jgi:hypothetical protein